MTSPRRILAVACLLIAALTPTAAAQQVRDDDDAAPRTPSTVYLPGRLIVSFDRGVTGADRADTRADADTNLVQTLGRPDFQLLDVGEGQTTSDAIAELRADPDVSTVSRDGLAAPQAVPNDPLVGKLWGIQNLGGPTGVEAFPNPVAGADANLSSAWIKTIGTPSTVVADLDSGYRFEHPDLASRAWVNAGEQPNDGVDNDGNGYVDDVNGYDFVGPSSVSPSSDANPTDDDLVAGGHGVHTAGTIGAAGGNGVGITGVAQNIRIMPLRVCGYSSQTGDSRCPYSSQIAAINYAGKNGARAANMSLGGTSGSAAELDAFARNPGTLFVISAGNDAANNDTSAHYPCNYNPASTAVAGAVDNVVCVAATDQADGLASFSDYGATTVDLGAPGTEILSTYPSTTLFADDFEDAGATTSRWTSTGTDGGFGRTNESPLTSFGFSDSPGASPVPNTVRESTSAPIAIPADATSCRLQQVRTLRQGSGASYTYQLLKDDGTVLANASPTTTGLGTLAFSGVAGANVRVRLRFTTTSATPADSSLGVWVDDLNVTCLRPVGNANAYEYLQGTSMAAPHVTGTAALLFSYKPQASVTNVRRALIASAKPIASLAGKTASGGRLDASAALDALDAAKPTSAATAVEATPASTIDVGYTADGTGSALTTVELWAKAPGASIYTLAATKTAPAATPVTSGTFTYSANAGDGDYSFYTVSHDAAGNDEDAPAGPDAVTSVDTVAPTSIATAPANSAARALAIGYGADGTGSRLAAVELWVKGPGDAAFALAQTDSTPAPSGRSFAWTAPSDGTYAFYARARDAAGNVEEAPVASDVQTAIATPVAPASSSSGTGSSLGEVVGPATVSSGTTGTSGTTPRPGACANPLATGGLTRLIGTAAGDLIVGGAKADTIDGGSGDDCLEGRGGKDRLHGGAGADRLSGGAGTDALFGDAGPDKIAGGSGNDKLTGGAGNDTLAGAAGNDVLTGGSGRNKYSAGGGKDVIAAANGVVETVDCGAGRDRATVDKKDRVVGCERVRRRR